MHYITDVQYKSNFKLHLQFEEGEWRRGDLGNQRSAGRTGALDGCGKALYAPCQENNRTRRPPNEPEFLAREILKIILPEMVQRIRELHPLRIVLFGSYAWGAPSSDSDLDLLVVTNSKTLSKTFRKKCTNVSLNSGVVSLVKSTFRCPLFYETPITNNQYPITTNLPKS